jgi:hypothetical protein
MKFELDLHDDTVDAIIIAWLKDSLDTIDNWQGNIHPDDAAYNEKLRPALIQVLDYMGEQVE